MSKLYVVNATGQNRSVNYRLDYTVDDQGRRTSERLVPYKTQSIRAREQVQFGTDWHPLQVQSIIAQLEETCGAHHVDAIRTAKRMGVVKMVWSLDKPVSAAVLRDVVDHNMGVLSTQGEQRRRNLAIAADLNLQTILNAEPQKLEMEFEGVDNDADAPKLTEGFRVKRDVAAPKPKPSRARRAAAA